MKKFTWDWGLIISFTYTFYLQRQMSSQMRPKNDLKIEFKQYLQKSSGMVLEIQGDRKILMKIKKSLTQEVRQKSDISEHRSKGWG